MADKKGGSIIIVKKKGGGHGGAHGGAWKVAFADFMTAMMCFFLVMWLMGSDEEVKSVVSQYFNNPSTPWRKEMASQEIYPMGDRTGSGDNVLKGQGGANPEDLIQNPNMSVAQQPHKSLDERKEADTFEGKTPMEIDKDIEVLQYSISEDRLFDNGSYRLSEFGKKELTRMGNMMKRHKGHVQLKIRSTHQTDGFELATAKLDTVLKEVLNNRWIDEDRIQSQVITPSRNGPGEVADRGLASDGRPNLKVEFVFSKDKL
jgi:flagellar motor protein MotB